MALPAPSGGATAVVTGASSGIGVEIARQLAQRGHGVTLVARREEKLRALADELATVHGVRAEVVAADLTDPDARDRVATEVDERGLHASILVNNAGLSTMGPVSKADVADEVAMLRTDVEAVVHLTTRFLPGMVERGAGAILNVASTAAFQPLPGQAGYGASKSFVLSYGQAVRAELRGTGVTVTTLCPGPVDTGFGEAAGISSEDAVKALPKFMWEDVKLVAKVAVDGLAHGRAVVIPGLANRVGARLAYLAPRGILLPVMARQHPGLK